MRLHWPRPESNPLSPALDDGWRHWVATRRGRCSWQRWTTEFPELAGLGPRNLFADHDSADRALGTLVALAQGNDPDRAAALYLLLVRLRPGLIRLARDRSWGAGHGPGSDHLAVAHEVAATFFEIVLVHDLNRRPSRIAANLLLDTRQRMIRSAGSEPAVGSSRFDRSPPTDHPAPSRPVTDESTLSVRSALRSELAALPGVEHSRRLSAEIAYRAWFLDQSHETIANHVDLEPGAVATRLCRVRAGLRERLSGLPA